jgi:CHASE2 domain-containing sensor protein
MRAYAKEAILISGGDEGGLKTYQIVWVNKNGEEFTNVAVGADMKSALQTVLRAKKLSKLSGLPEWTWFLIYSIFIGTYAVAAFTLNRPLLVTLGSATLIASVKLMFDRYFRYVK